jgi:hypothetical protein
MAYVLDPRRAGALIEDSWPCLFYGPERIPEVRRRIQSHAWAKRLYAAMLDETKVALASAPRLPQGRPGWRHDFYSPATGEHLVFTRDPDGGFLDPADGTPVIGSKQQAAWVLLEHERIYRVMRSIALLYRLTGKEDYAEWAIEGLHQASEFFRLSPRYPENHNALYFQPLYDAQVLLVLAGVDGLLAGSDAYGESARESLLREVLGKGTRSLLSHQRGSRPHNITCYVTAALAAAGLATGNKAHVELAVSEDVHGLMGLLEQGLRKDDSGDVDGFWFEGTTFYHFYAMFPLFKLFDIATSQPIEPGQLEKARTDLAEMARAPPSLADQDLRLPWLGDLGSPEMPGLSAFTQIYEYASGVLDPSLAGVVAACLKRGGERGITALLYGPDEGGIPPPVASSSLLGASGIGILRERTRQGPYFLLLRAGRHGAGHDHFDKLEVVYHALGRVLLPDLGTPGYSLREFRGYCRSTLAHNALMVDESSQGEAFEGGIARSGPRSFRGWVKAYEGVLLERTITLDPPRITLEDHFSSSSSHRYSTIFHAPGRLTVDIVDKAISEPLPPMPEDGPFSYLRSRMMHGYAAEAAVQWGVDEQLKLVGKAEWSCPFEITTGTTPYNPMSKHLGTVLMRGRAREVWARTDLVTELA